MESWETFHENVTQGEGPRTLFAMAMTRVLLRTAAVPAFRKRLGGRRVVDDISFTAAAGRLPSAD
jgi:hypothetical protein